MRQRGGALPDLVRLLAAAPAARLGLKGRKGAVLLGADADLVAFDPEASFLVRGAELCHRHKITPYEGRELHGVVEKPGCAATSFMIAAEATAPRAEMILRREVVNRSAWS